MDSGNIGDLDHTGHTDQATTQVVSEKSSKSKNELWAQTPKAPSRTDEASPTVAAQQNLHDALRAEDTNNNSHMSPTDLAALMDRVDFNAFTVSADMRGDRTRMIIKQGLSTEVVFNAIIKIFTLAGVKHERSWFPVTAEYLLRAETEQQALRPIVGALLKIDATRYNGRQLKHCGAQSMAAAQLVIDYSRSGLLSAEIFAAILNAPEFEAIRVDLRDVLYDLDKVLFDELQANFHVDLASFKGAEVVAVTASVSELARSVNPSPLATPGLQDINLRSTALARDLLRIVGTPTEDHLRDLIASINEGLSSLEKRSVVTWDSRSPYFEQLKRLIDDATNAHIALSLNLAGDCDSNTLPGISSIGNHLNVMLKLAPQNAPDLMPVLKRLQELATATLQFEAAGTPPIEVLAQAKRGLGNYCQFLTGLEASHDMRREAERRIPPPPKPTIPDGAAALPVTAAPPSPNAEELAALQRELAALKKQVAGGGSGGRGGNGRKSGGGGGPRISAAAFDEYHRRLYRYHVLNADGTIKVKRCGAFCRAMQHPRNPLHTVEQAERRCKSKGSMAPDEQGVLRCKHGDHPPWSTWTETMRGDGNPVPGPQ